MRLDSCACACVEQLSQKEFAQTFKEHSTFVTLLPDSCPATT